MKLVKLLLIATFSFAGLTSNAQAYIKATFVGTPQPGTCNNTVACEEYNYSGHNRIELSQNMIPIHEVQHLDTIYNFCFDVNYMDLHQFELIRSNGYSSTGSGPAGPLLPKFEFDILNYQAPSGDSIYDGQITIQFDSIVDQNIFGYDLLASFNNPDLVVHSFLDDYTVEFDSLTRGEFRFFFFDTINSSATTQNIFVGDLDPDYMDTGLQVSVNYQHSNGNCEGFIDVFAMQENSGSDMGIIWADDQNMTNFSRTSLCPGMYSFYAYEFLAGQYTGAHIDTFILTNSNTSFIDSSLYNTIPDDTLTYQIDNCSFDYNVPIDSVVYNLDTLSLTQDSLVGLFQLTIFQQLQSTYIEDTVFANVDSTTVLDIVLYCDDSTGQKLAFRSQQFMILMDSEGFIYSNNLSLDELKPSGVSIYPNPFIDELSIDSDDGSVIDVIHLLDAQGTRRIFELPRSTNVNLNLHHLSSGTYFLWYKVRGNWYQEKVVKL